MFSERFQAPVLRLQLSEGGGFSGSCSVAAVLYHHRGTQSP